MAGAPLSLVATASLDDVALWARTNGLEIVFIVTGSVLLARLVGFTSALVTRHIDAQSGARDPLVRSEEAKHRHAVTNVVRWVTIVLLYFVAFVLVVQRMDVPLTSLVAPATVAGVAVGFGAQRVVQDVLAGFLIITERQYGFGDVIRFSTLGATTGVTGTVEDVTLRITRLRTVNGEVVIVPNGQIVQVTNLSRDWARAVIDVPIPPTVDVNRVSALLREVGEAAFGDAQLRPLLLDTPSVMGVESLAVDQLEIRLVARTLPGRQFEVGRALRSRIAVAFLREGLSVPTALTADPTAGDDMGAGAVRTAAPTAVAGPALGGDSRSDAESGGTTGGDTGTGAGAGNGGSGSTGADGDGDSAGGTRSDT